MKKKPQNMLVINGLRKIITVFWFIVVFIGFAIRLQRYYLFPKQQANRKFFFFPPSCTLPRGEHNGHRSDRLLLPVANELARRKRALLNNSAN